MSSNAVKVINNNSFDVGVNLIDGVRSINIKKNSFTVLTPEEVLFINSVSCLFREGLLTTSSEKLNRELKIPSGSS